MTPARRELRSSLPNAGAPVPTSEASARCRSPARRRSTMTRMCGPWSGYARGAIDLRHEDPVALLQVSEEAGVVPAICERDRA